MPPAFNRDSEPSPFELVADDGAVIRGQRSGPPDGPPVVLLHGGGQTRHAWAEAARVLAGRGYEALAVDQRGHGESDWAPREDYLVDDFAADLRRLVATLGDHRPRPVLVGASLGGLVGLVCAGEAPKPLFRGLVLVDIALNLRPEGVKRILEFMSAHPEGFASLEEAAEAVAAYLPHRARRRDASGLAKNLRRWPDGRWRWHYDPRFVTGSFVPDLRGHRERLFAAAANLRCPTLLVHGGASDVVGEDEVEHFLETVPGARAVAVGDAAHMVAGDKNDAFNDAVLAFLGEIRETTTEKT